MPLYADPHSQATGSQRLSIRFACPRCRTLITDWRATVDAPSGRIVIEGHCHGEVFPIMRIIEAQGVAFYDGSVLSLESRYPDDWIGEAEEEGASPVRRTG